MSELGDAIEPEIVALPSAPEPVPEEPPPGVVDLLARSARLGVDVVGLVAGELASASARLARNVLNQTIGAILDMVDWDMLIQKIPAERLVANIDLGGIVRESTTSLAGETVDAVRVGMMGVDLWVARVVDRVLRRKQPRDLVVAGYDVNAPEVRIPKALL